MILEHNYNGFRTQEAVPGKTRRRYKERKQGIKASLNYLYGAFIE